LSLFFSAPVQASALVSPALGQYLESRCETPARNLRPAILFRFARHQEALAQTLCQEVRTSLAGNDIQASPDLQCGAYTDQELTFKLLISNSCRYPWVIDATDAANPVLLGNARQDLEASRIPLPALPEAAAGTAEHQAWSDQLERRIRARHPEHIRAIQESLLRVSGGPKNWAAAARERPELKHWLTMLLEISSALGAGATYYYTHQEWASADWDLGPEDFWRKAALRTGTLSLDTNDIYVNGISHPLAGMTYYLAARTNRFSPLESVAISFISSYIWEVLIENRELTSLNDLYFTPFAGAVLGEAVYALGEFLNCRFSGRHGIRACTKVAQQMDVSTGVRTGLEIDQEGRPGVRSELHLRSEADRRPVESALPPSVLVPGDWNQLSLLLGTIHDGNARGSLGIEVRNLLLGIQGAVLPSRNSGRKTNYRIDLQSGFVFKDAPLGSQQDRHAILEVLGVRARIRIPVGNLQLEIQTSLSGDLMIVESWAFTPWVGSQPDPRHALSRADSTLRIRGFSHLGGLSARAGIRLQDLNELWRIELTAIERNGWKIEGQDRFPERATRPVEGLTEQRLDLRGSADIRIPDAPVRAGISVEHERGRSQVAETRATSTSTRVLGTLTFEFR